VKAGDLVYFGLPRGEKTAGWLVSVSGPRAKVRLMEARGKLKPGAVTTVPLSQVISLGEHRIYRAADGEVFLKL